MKKLLGSLFFALVVFVMFARCNDDGTGEPRDPRKIVKTKPLEKQYAGFGILACVAVLGVWAVGNKAVRNQKPDRIKY